MDEALAIKGRLLVLLEEDPANSERILARLDGIRQESGISAHSALLLILTDLSFDEDAARKHWEEILAHREALSRSLERDVGLRVAVFDYFVNVNRRLSSPKIIDLEMYEHETADTIADAETGLANLRYFRLALQNEIRRSRRYGLGFAIARVAFDDAEEFEARRGRILFDIVLREIAMLIRNRIRDIDLAARVSHSSFAVLFPETDRTGAFAVVDRIRREVARHFQAKQVEDRPLELTVSAGLAKQPEDGTNTDEILERAEEALHRARSRGKSSIDAYYRERRHFLRFDLQRRGLTLRVVGEGQGIESLTAPRGNISRSGLLFESPEAVAVGSAVELTFHELDGSPPASVHGRVARLEELPPREGHPRYDIGVAFLFEYEHEESEFIRFFERFDPTLGRKENP